MTTRASPDIPLRDLLTEIRACRHCEATLPLGANPVEYLLTALAGCLTTSMIYHAAARGITINAVESDLEGELDLRGFLGLSDEVRNGYKSICVSFRIDADVPQETIDELIGMAKARSPVFDMLSNPVDVLVKGEPMARATH